MNNLMVRKFGPRVTKALLIVFFVVLLLILLKMIQIVQHLILYLKRLIGELLQLQVLGKSNRKVFVFDYRK